MRVLDLLCFYLYYWVMPNSFIASSIAGAVDKLINAMQQDKQLLNHRVSFSPHHPKYLSKPNAPVDHNTPLLRQGTYIVFAEEVDGSSYTLQEDGSVSPNPNVSYVVFSIDQDSTPSPDWINSQRVAMLLTHLKEGNPNAEQAPIEFLTSTLAGYSNFNKLQRYQDLWEKKQKDPKSLAPAEQALLDQIAAIPELKPFSQK